MAANHLQAVDFRVNAADDVCLKYGENTLIVCPDVRFPGSRTSGVTLSCSMDEPVPGCRVTAIPFTEPRVRNCFKIRGIGNGCEDGEPLKFGDTFFISPCVSSKPLFVAADPPGLYAERATFTEHPTLKLVDAPDAHCRWTVTYWNAAWQLEAQRLPVPNGAHAILKHTSSDRNVAVETSYKIPTLFGDEFEVSAHPHQYCGRRAEDRYMIWQFVAGRPQS